VTQQKHVVEVALARGPWIRRVCLAGALLLTLAAPLSAQAQVESREGIALQNQLYQLRQELQVLRSDVGRMGGVGGGGGGGDIAAQLLARVQAMEEQVRQLRGKIDETQNLVNRQYAEMSKRIEDLTFQLNLQGGRSGALTPLPSQMPTPPPIREVSPRPLPEVVPRPSDPAPRPPDLNPRLVVPAPMPSVIPPPPPPPPQSFTFNQTPQPMRETPPPPPRIESPKIEPARIDPPKIEPTRPVPAPKPAPPAEAVQAPPTEVAIAVLPPGGKRTPEMALQEGHAALARRDYSAAERAAREVMSIRASPRVYDGQFLLAQSLAGQKQFAQAAIAFDDTYNRSHKGRHAQDALLGLAGALTAINERRAACDTLGRLRTEFPEVRADLRESITKTNERAACGR
jgi:TolA-binding protein